MVGRSLDLLWQKNRRGHWVLVLSLVLAIVLAVAVVSNGAIASERAAGAASRSAQQEDGFWYTVRAGDYRSAIAARFGVTVTAIVQANNITNPNLIRVGQQLWIPGAGAPAPTASPTPTGTSEPTATPQPTETPAGGFYYTVRSGDTLSGIAARFGTTVTAIMQANNITNPNLIRVGQQLWIPGGSGSPQPTSPATEQLGYGFGIQPWGADMNFVVDATQGAGFNWVRFQAPWRDFERDGKGQYAWGDLDTVINRLHETELYVAVSIVKAPAWARPAATDLSVDGPPANPQDFADFLTAFAQRYQGKVHAVQLWNEPNLWHEWGNEPLNAARYVQLLCAGHRAVKAVDPTLKVISAGLTPTGVNDGKIAIDDVEFLRRIYQNGGRNCFDGLGAHPSGYNNPPDVRFGYSNPSEPGFKNHPSFFFQETLLRYRNVMTANGDGAKRIWPTEFGWASSLNPAPGYEYAADVTLEEQAQYLVKSYEMMKAWGWVGPAFAWNLNFGVADGESEMAQFVIWGRPAYAALRDMPK
jgi:LysM repeat protein